MKIIANKNIVLLQLLSIFILVGCSNEEFLDRSPKDQPVSDNFFIDESSARQAINACYHPWARGNANMYTRDLVMHLDALSDDSYYRPARPVATALEQWNISPTHENVVSWWRYPFQAINAANFALENIPNSKDPNFTEEKQRPYLGEALFYRAFSYQFLTLLYGDVPIHLGPTDTFEEFYRARSSRAEVLDQVIADFALAKEYLDDPLVKGAPGKAAAAAYLAKAYLIKKDWENAEIAARDAISIAENAGYGLEAEYLDIWEESNEGGKELLFYWGFVENDERYGGNHGVQRVLRDAPVEIRSIYKVDGWGYALPQRDLYDEFEEGDPRREYTIHSPGTVLTTFSGPDFSTTYEYYDDAGNVVSEPVTYTAGDPVIYDYRWSPTGLNVRKNTRSVLELANIRWSGMDEPAMRMAELYLILAEALAERGSTEAYTWVNKVRSRPSVNMPDVSSGDLVEVVRHERRVELAMEGIRIFDLIRWGEVSSVFGDGKKVKRHFYSDYMDDSNPLKYDAPIGNLSLDPLFPLPQSEIDNNPNINENNPGW